MGKGPIGLRRARLRVEELNRLVRDLNASITEMSVQLSQLSAEVPQELPPITARKEGYLAYGSYIRDLDQRKTRLELSLAEMTDQHDLAQKELHLAQQELDRLEQLYAKRLPRAPRGRRPANAEEKAVQTVFG